MLYNSIYIKFETSNLIYHVGNQGLLIPFGQEGVVMMGRVSGVLLMLYFLSWVVVTGLYSCCDNSPSYTGVICVLLCILYRKGLVKAMFLKI